MRRPRARSVVVATVVPVLLTLMSAAPASSGAEPSDRRPVDAARHSIDWGPCEGAPPAYQCATVRVPLDYDRPRGPRTELALARYRASGPGEPRGSVFVNPGGPGG